MNALMQLNENKAPGHVGASDDLAGASPDQPSDERSPADRRKTPSLQEFIARAEKSGHLFHFT